jgi:chorismate mutase
MLASSRRTWDVAALAAGLVLALPGLRVQAKGPAADASADAAKVEKLLGLIADRLAVAPEVARTKWNTHAAIEDLPREAQITRSVAQVAPEHGLAPACASAFFQAQIDASKIVQRALHQEWTSRGQPAFEKVPDLAKEIRPVLDRLTPALLKALAEASSALVREEDDALLESWIRTRPAGDVAAARAALVPLRSGGACRGR